MFKRLFGAFLVAAPAAGLFLSCGGSSSSTTTTTGTLLSFIGDTPSCDILSFHVLATNVTLTPQTGTGTTNAFPANYSVTVNFAAWQGASTVLSAGSVPANTYTQGSLVMSIPTLVIYDPTQSPPCTATPQSCIRTVTATLPSTTPTFPIEPSLTVTGGKVAGLAIDFNMLNSLQFQTDSTGTLTATITPSMTFAGLTASTTQGFGITTPRGFVLSVAPTSSSTSANGTPFIGSFLTQTLSPSLNPASGQPPSGPQLTTNLTSTTQFCGPVTGSELCPALPLNTLLAGSFGNIQGYVDSNGNYIANFAEIEDQEVVSQQKVAFLGPVLSVNKDANGNVTQFSLFVREEQPNVEFGTPNVTLDTVVTVNPTSSTVYGDVWRVAHPGNLQLGPTALAVGQQIAVSGVYTPPPSGVTPAPQTTVAADSIYLQSQPYQGNFSSLLQAGRDDKSGAFVFVPCGTMFRGAPVTVFTNSQTTFLNVSGLNELTPQPSLLVKGLLFFDYQGTAINGVTVPPRSLVLLASQVDQLQ